MSQFDPGLPSVKQVQSYIQEKREVEIKLSTDDLLVCRILQLNFNCLYLVDQYDKPTLFWQHYLVYLRPKAQGEIEPIKNSLSTSRLLSQYSCLNFCTLSVSFADGCRVFCCGLFSLDIDNIVLHVYFKLLYQKIAINRRLLQLFKLIFSFFQHRYRVFCRQNVRNIT